MPFLLVVILIINLDYVLAFKREFQSSIAVHLHRPMAFQIAAQWVQTSARSIHIVRRLGAIQLEKLDGNFGGMGGLNSCLASGQEESFDAMMPEALDHMYGVALHYPAVKRLR
jgi:hypothetical protein